MMSFSVFAYGFRSFVVVGLWCALGAGLPCWGQGDTVRVHSHELLPDRSRAIAIKNERKNLEKRVGGLAKDLKAWYDLLHRNPELGYHEKKTASFISRFLESFGWKVFSSVGNSNSIIAEWGGATPRKYHPYQGGDGCSALYRSVACL